MAWRLTLRTGPKVEHRRFDAFDAAFDELEQECRAAAATTRRAPARGIARDYTPADQVAVRAELAGPGRARGGVDVRGDGSAAAFTGRVRRRPLEPRGGESPYAALRRALSGSTSVDP